jgi:hypothetical protein
MNDTTAVIADSQIREPHAPVGVFELPCGYLDPKDVLHTDVMLTELTGRDEDMLADTKTSAQRKMNQLLISCIARLGSLTDRNAIATAVPNMLVGDRVFLLIAIRRTSLGDEYPYQDKCPACEKESMFSLNLADLEVVKMPSPYKRVYEDRMPSSAALMAWANKGTVPEPEASHPTGRAVRFRMLTGKDEEHATSLKGKDAISVLLGTRLEALDETPVTTADLQNLTLKERLYIRDVLFRKYDGGVDTTLETGCPNCGNEFERELDISQLGFFFPSAARKSWKAKSSS